MLSRMENNWLPIETAPKDGTIVDLWVVDQDDARRRVTDAYWVTDRPFHYQEYSRDRSYRMVSFNRDGWFAPNQDYDGAPGWCDFPRIFNAHPAQNREIFTEPTHWMPAPSPPA